MSHVLIIEDDPDVIALLSHHLRNRGHEVSIAYDGSEGYLTALRERPDLVLLDLLLPAFTGHQVLHLLRTNPDVRRVPVVVISALDQSEQHNPYSRSRPDAYVAKPFRLEPLMREIDRLLAA
ncbi:MAG: response regulator [Planctomycetes bacterium]|nr:response regulator [Planctomycetota bacterium]